MTGLTMTILWFGYCFPALSSLAGVILYRKVIESEMNRFYKECYWEDKKNKPTAPVLLLSNILSCFVPVLNIFLMLGFMRKNPVNSNKMIEESRRRRKN